MFEKIKERIRTYAVDRAAKAYIREDKAIDRDMAFQDDVSAKIEELRTQPASPPIKDTSAPKPPLSYPSNPMGFFEKDDAQTILGKPSPDVQLVKSNLQRMTNVPPTRDKPIPTIGTQDVASPGQAEYIRDMQSLAKAGRSRKRGGPSR